MKQVTLPLLLALACLTPLAPAFAPARVHAQGRENSARPLGARADYELAREAVARGEILSLTTVLARVQARYPGRLLDVELEFDEDGAEYELEIATSDGRILGIEVNAVTGEILSVDEDD